MGQKLSDLTSQRVIVLILTMLICIPGFNWNSGLYGAYPSAFMGGLSSLHDAYTAYGNSTSFQQACLFLLHILCQACTVSPLRHPAGTALRVTGSCLCRRRCVHKQSVPRCLTPHWEAFRECTAERFRFAHKKLFVCMQLVVDYVEYDRYALVNRDTGFLLILIVCNNTIGYPGGPERGWGLRTPELFIERCLARRTEPSCTILESVSCAALIACL